MGRLFQLKSGRSSAPRFPQAPQTSRGSRSDSRMSSAIARRYGLLWLAFCQLDSKLSDPDICSQGGEYAMIRPKLISAALLFVTAGSMTSGASAITAELAKKCEALTAKAFPPRVIGNPAAGSAKGSGKDAQAYFNKCIKNGGRVDDSGSKEAK
jgi:hypothetical protein